MNLVQCSVPGRICLFGDHMDWLGYSVITSTINMRINCIAWSSDSNKANIYSYAPYSRYCEYNYTTKQISKENDLRYTQAVFKYLHEKNYEIPGINMVFYSEDGGSLISGRGLSSSAALCVSSATVIYLLSQPQSYLDLNFKTECAETAYQAENGVLSINCGRMDQYACAIGGVLSINCSNDSTKFNTYRCLSDVDIVIGDTGKEKDTKKILEWLKNRYQDEEPELRLGISKIREVVEKARDLLEHEPDYIKLGSLLDENQRWLKEYLHVSGDCPISNSSLDELIYVSKKAGAFGAKITGSGGGGCMIALTNPKKTEHICKEISDIGGTPYKVKSTKKGININRLEVKN